MRQAVYQLICLSYEIQYVQYVQSIKLGKLIIMKKQKIAKTTPKETNFSCKIDPNSRKIIDPIQYVPTHPIVTKRSSQIIKNVNDILFKLKRGKDTPGIHIRTLFGYMENYKHHYINDDYYQRAFNKVKKIMDSPINTSSLWNIFGGQYPAKDASKQVKDQFLINRLNARVLELIYQRHLMHIVFGSSKIEDKLTTLMFIQQYRSRLCNPLLCGKIQCPRPKLPQKNQTQLRSVINKQKTIRK